MPEKITATFRITTPMFIGDANQKATGISPAAVKGGLRFWWRALTWGGIRKSADSDEAALRQLHKAESRLFGSAADQGAGQAKALIRVKTDVTKYGLPTEKPGSGTQYLLGQGLYHFKNGYLRDSALLSGRMHLEIMLKPDLSDKDKQQLQQAAIALGLFGALGSRARKGFGSISLANLESSGKSLALPQNRAELKSLLNDWKESSTDKLPPFSAFSTLSRIDVSSLADNPSKLQELAGHEMQLYRSWGRNGRVNGQPSEKNFKDDHDNVLNVSKNIKPPTIPRRSVFGLPHNYFYSSPNPKVKVDITPKESSRNRRASPLLIHIHQFPDGEYALIQTLLPAKFLAENEKVEFKPKPGRTVDLPFSQSQVDWQVMHIYLDRFNQRERVL